MTKRLIAHQPDTLVRRDTRRRIGLAPEGLSTDGGRSVDRASEPYRFVKNDYRREDGGTIPFIRKYVTRLP